MFNTATEAFKKILGMDTRLSIGMTRDKVDWTVTSDENKELVDTVVRNIFNEGSQYKTTTVVADTMKIVFNRIDPEITVAGGHDYVISSMQVEVNLATLNIISVAVSNNKGDYKRFENEELMDISKLPIWNVIHDRTKQEMLATADTYVLHNTNEGK